MKALLDKARRLIEDLTAQVSARFGRDVVLTDRLKLLISVASIVLVLAGVLGTRQIASNVALRHIRAQTDMARLKAQIERGGWEERKQQSQVLKALLEERLWTAQTPGLADASFERWLRDRLNQYRVEPLQQIQVRRVPVSKQNQGGGAPDVLLDLQRMTAKIILPFDAPAISGFLADLAEGEKMVTVDRMVVRTGRNARVEIDVSAFFRSHERS